MTSNNLLQTLRTQFHFENFRPGQLAAIEALLTHGRLLCIQPTGHGKSLLYQLPAVLLEGMTLVISPLLALMRDQVQQLKNRFAIPAASINTDQTEQENHLARQAAMRGEIRILFIAPEQLDQLDKFNFLLALPIKLLVVDEAHCISTWGHDFRPSYREIIKLAHALATKKSDIRILGLTATANAKTEKDIKQQLKIDRKKIMIHRESMDRPNIRLSVIPAEGLAGKFSILTQLLPHLLGCGIIYCATRENTELVAEYLKNHDINTIAYHAGIDPELKRRIQMDFLLDKYTVISATNALGMGIDKPNLRYIIHFDFPGSITAYYQEVGRAGRDGKAAEGVLLYDPRDSKIQKYFIETSEPSLLDFKITLNAIDTTHNPTLTQLKRDTGLHPTKLNVVISELIEQGFVEKISHNRTQLYKITHKKGNPDLTRYEIQCKTRLTELQSMQRYAEQQERCLMAILRDALGDNHPTDCGQCSVCTKNLFNLYPQQDEVITISAWLNRRSVPIILSKKTKNIAPGIAVLDGKLRSEDFVFFMKKRSQEKENTLTANLLDLIKKCLQDLNQHHDICGLVPIPSRTWLAKDDLVEMLAQFLRIPVFDLLCWTKPPEARQGELLNNDQRNHNVTHHMGIGNYKKIPAGSLLLFDDYIGSGATLNEAARVLRESASIQNQIIPFTIAAIKWKLGKSGMI